MPSSAQKKATMFSRMIGVAAVVISTAGPPVFGEEVGVYFSGSVSNVFQDPFQGGITAVPATLVSGRVLFDTHSSATDPISTCDCMGYRQHIPGGFTATFGDTIVRADDYVVQIKNDIHQSWGLTDTLAVRFSGGFSPPLASPLIVNGNPYPTSWFQINMDGPSDVFADASLPQSLDLSSFSSTYNFLDEITTDLPIGVVFSNESLSAYAPQPGEYNRDLLVNNTDYDSWRSAFGSASRLDADGNRDGIVDAADFVMWRKNDSSVIGAAVPESTILSLFTGGTLSLWFLGCFRRCREASACATAIDR
jgi:hypothetical protein